MFWSSFTSYIKFFCLYYNVSRNNWVCIRFYSSFPYYSFYRIRICDRCNTGSSVYNIKLFIHKRWIKFTLITSSAVKDFINLIAIIIVIPLLRLYLHFFGLGALHGGFIRYVASLFSEYKTKNLLNQPAFVPISTMKRNNVQLFPFVNCRKFSSFTSSCLRLGTGEPRIKQNSDADPDVNSYLS